MLFFSFSKFSFIILLIELPKSNTSACNPPTVPNILEYFKPIYKACAPPKQAPSIPRKSLSLITR